MGSWNETDMMTGLPIETGTPIVGFLIIPNEITAQKLRCNSYADSRWQPISMPIFGVYDGYGQIGNIENEREVAKDITCLFSLKFNLVHHNDDLLTIENNSLEVNRCELVHDGDRLPTELVFVRKKFFDFAMQTKQSKEIVAKYNIASNNYLDVLKKYLPELKEASSIKDDETMMLKIEKINKCRNKVAELLTCSVFAPNAAIQSLITAGYNLAQTAAMTHFLDSMRLQWIPTIGKGSQTTIDSKEKIKFYKLVTRTAKEIYQMRRKTPAFRHGDIRRSA